MKKYLMLAALMLCAAPAFATNCTNGATNYPKCDNNKPPTTQPPSNHNGQAQGQGQGQQQGQGQGQGQGQNQTATGGGGGQGTGIGVGIGQGGRGGAGGQGGSAAGGNATGGASNSDASATGGNASSNSGVNGSGNSAVRSSNTNTSGSNSDSRSGANSASSSGADARNSGGNSNTSVDTSDRSVTNIEGSNFFAPGDLPANAMNIVAGSYITTAGDTECGVLVSKIQVPVYQWDKKGKKKRQVGYDEDVQPMLDANGVQIDYQPVYTGEGEGYMRGSHVTYVLYGKGNSNSSQFGAQGYAPGGGGGISYGKGNAYSEGGTKIIIRPCIAYKFSPKPVAKPVVRRPVVKKRKPAVRRPQPCVERTATTCPAK